jgi:leukotriene-A4 hydrolase
MRNLQFIAGLAGLVFFSACQPSADSGNTTATTTPSPTYTEDPHSYAQPNQAVTKHLDLELSVDFEQQLLKGVAHWKIEQQQAKQIVFDSRNLTIEKVTAGTEIKEDSTTFVLGDSDPLLGAPLTIDLPEGATQVSIYYQTQPDGAAALDWLKPIQTASKSHPFLFTQGQAILTRTWIPCQDSPGIRITYNATVTVPSDMMAVMSASNPQEKNDTGVYSFEMKQPIPPYLLALAAGNLEFKPISDNTGIYAEPPVVDAAVDEFADIPEMLNVAESLYGPYLWDRYDVIVLPPSFPFGGMENPRLTFATPTIIAGDRSLTALIAHELAHSWSGNLVTNATWDDFWLNEGFTVYFERRIMEGLYGKEYADMLALLGYQDLEEDVHMIGEEEEDTHLKLDLAGRDPDDGMTDIAYEKGAFFLMLLEEKVGREVFDDFLKNYFETHKFQTLTTETFIVYLKEHLLEPNQVNINLDEWIYGPGIPDNCPKVSSSRFEQVDASLQQFISGTTPVDLSTKDWSSHEWLHFIRHLPTDLSLDQMGALDRAFFFSNSGNSELLAAWFNLSLRNGYSATNMPQIESFLIRVGRRKFLSPLYRAFKESGQMEAARAIYAKAKPNYHSVSRGTIESILEI